jgi:hypothetical protein
MRAVKIGHPGSLLTGLININFHRGNSRRDIDEGLVADSLHVRGEKAGWCGGQAD